MQYHNSCNQATKGAIGHRSLIFLREHIILKIELPEVTKFGLREPSVDVLAINRGMSVLELQVPAYSAQNRIFLYSYYCGLFNKIRLVL